jgi:hypoxanthine phosphoribosyltransferase
MGTVTSPAATLLIARRDLAARVEVLGRELRQAYADASEPAVFISVLKGSTMFLADLIRAVEIDLEVDFMAISSYGRRAGVVRIVKDLETDIGDRDVVIVEDIVDTGLTLTYLKRTLLERRPRSLRTVTLLDKTVRRIVPVAVEHSGFDVPDVFVVGYGLDFQGRYRNLPDILAVGDLEALAADPLALVKAAFGHA